MGLDQSIFTTSKSLAKDICYGYTTERDWSNALLSVGYHQEGEKFVNDLAHYYACRIADLSGDTTDIGNQGAMVHYDSEVERDIAENIDEVILRATTQTKNLYQIGFWHRFNALQGWFARLADRRGYYLGSDDLMPVSVGDLTDLREACHNVAEAYDRSEAWGRHKAEHVLPTCEGPRFGIPFGSTRYDEKYVSDVRETEKFCDVVLSLATSEEETFFYNPWW